MVNHTKQTEYSVSEALKDVVHVVYCQPDISVDSINTQHVNQCTTKQHFQAERQHEVAALLFFFTAVFSYVAFSQAFTSAQSSQEATWVSARTPTAFSFEEAVAL